MVGERTGHVLGGHDGMNSDAKRFVERDQSALAS
jgi:hypothetical protein